MSTENIMDFVRTIEDTAPRITLFGKRGIGKSTLASQFPDPLFLLTEDNGLTGIKALPMFDDYIALWTALDQLYALKELPFKTLVIDSISKLDDIVVEYTIKKSPPVGRTQRPAETMAEAWGGYGAGFEKAAQVHRSLKCKLDRFKARGVGVVYIAHHQVVTYKAPDQEDYQIYTILINHDRSRAIYCDDVDAVLYCKQKSFITETESGRSLVKSSDQRIICSTLSDGNVSKTRYKMPNEIPLNFDELKQYIPFYNNKD